MKTRAGFEGTETEAREQPIAEGTEAWEQPTAQETEASEQPTAEYANSGQQPTAQNAEEKKASAAAKKEVPTAGSGNRLLELLMLPAAIPAAIFAYAAGKRRSRKAAAALAAGSPPLRLAAPAIAELRAAWRKLERAAAKAAAAEAAGAAAAGSAIAGAPAAKPAAPTPAPAAQPGANAPPAGKAAAWAGLPKASPAWSAEAAAAFGAVPQLPGGPAGDAALVQRIRAETARMNRNNVTRTEAYRAFYLRRPEVHWALLAHMVSRNGGWNMTDLQGEWLPRLLDMSKRRCTFGMLERANALIFHDAYPQLRLYEESRRSGRSQLHLLPRFGVSVFMQPIWQQFLRTGDALPLTIGLIVNEQHFIEERVVQNPYYRRKVLNTFFFGMQSVLQLNQLVFPYGKDEGGDPLVAGLILEDFSDLHERIEFGKRLYALLFGMPGVSKGVLAFVKAIRHTGSRSDYAPELFAQIRRGKPTVAYQERLRGGRLLPGAEPLYSPPLSAVWSDRPFDDPDPGDWFKGPEDVLPYFRSLPTPERFELTADYRIALGKVELAVLAAQSAGMDPNRTAASPDSLFPESVSPDDRNGNSHVVHRSEGNAQPQQEDSST
ncbi:Protein of unknown function [Paenibacillaceae bacterium GAS479]|nr:Protein of unknown function [Paenibacillaceae bacterium GAS479]